MLVADRMTKELHTIGSDETIADALSLMREKNVRRLPVIKGRKLVGIITERKLMEVSPSPATSLSIFELNYLLSKTKIKDIMTKNVITIAPDSMVEIAAVIMRNNGIGGLPVVNGGNLLGIITESDIFSAFIEIMGFADQGCRIEISTSSSDNKPGQLAKITGVFASHDINISNIIVDADVSVVIKVTTMDADEAIDELKNIGYNVVSVVKTMV